MNAPDRHPDRTADWTEANQRLLAAEFRRLRALLGEGDPAAAAAEAQALRAAMPAPAAPDRLARLFCMSGFERDLLLLAAGAEMDAALARRCGGGADVTFGLALATLPDPHWSALAPVRPLRHWRMVEFDARSGLTTARLRIDERLLHHLAGVDYLDSRLQPLLRPLPVPAAMAPSQRRIATAAQAALAAAAPGGPAVVALSGDDAEGQAEVAAMAAAGLGLRLHALRAEDLPPDPAEQDALALLWQREAVLSGLALLIDCGGADAARTVARFTDRMGGTVFLSSRAALPLAGGALAGSVLPLSVDRPDAGEQRQLWTQALGPAAQGLGEPLDGVAAQFRLSARTIFAKARELRAAAVDGGAEAGAMLRGLCRQAGRTVLDDLALRVAPAAGWDDLILPDEQKSTLRQIAAQVRHRLKVHGEWGFAAKGARGLGISALFAGESGTGKTMAAEVLAGDLDLDLYRIDLSSVVSKYIGETEKNLCRVFDAAEQGGAILLFDECDALFGKRSEVRDSHDRYANIEVSYLLQRMESYPGLAMLTTNHQAALDAAFQRRLRFVVHFPFPDRLQREGIWRSVFPAATPVDGLDYARLSRLSVAGGHIRSIALNAAFLAAGSGQPVGMAHLQAAARSEAAKSERPLAESEMRGWV